MCMCMDGRGWDRHGLDGMAMGSGLFGCGAAPAAQASKVFFCGQRGGGMGGHGMVWHDRDRAGQDRTG